MKKLTKTEILNAVREAKSREQAFVEMNAKETNPQIVKMATEAQGKVEAYESVIYAFTYNSLVMLKI